MNLQQSRYAALEIQSISSYYLAQTDYEFKKIGTNLAKVYGSYEGTTLMKNSIFIYFGIACFFRWFLPAFTAKKQSTLTVWFVKMKVLVCSKQFRVREASRRTFEFLLARIHDKHRFI